MKKIFFLPLFLIVHSSISNAQSYFAHLGEMFYQGEVPVVEEILQTPWTGRCFNRATPNRPSNIGLYIREREVMDDTGPIRIPQYEISNYTFHNRAADYLDDKDHAYLERLIEPFYEVLDIGDDHFSFFNRQSGRSVWAYLRRNGDYLVQSFYDQYGREGKIRCYYWKTF